ncbi:hypothetical protein MCBRY_002754 [Methylocystis bryophila]
MTVVTYSFNNDPLYTVTSLSSPPPSTGTPEGYLSGSFTVDFATNSVISSSLGFTPVGGASVTFANPNFAVATPPGGFSVYIGSWSGPGISGGPDFISTDATGYEAVVDWLQASGSTPSTVAVDYLGPNSTINTTTGDVTGTFLANIDAPVIAQVLDSAPGPLPGAGLPALALLVLVLVASICASGSWGRGLPRLRGASTTSRPRLSAFPARTESFER